MTELSWVAIKRLVYERAQGYCEYCQTAEENSGQTMQVDHIDPQGGDTLEIYVSPVGAVTTTSAQPRGLLIQIQVSRLRCITRAPRFGKITLSGSTAQHAYGD